MTVVRSGWLPITAHNQRYYVCQQTLAAKRLDKLYFISFQPPRLLTLIGWREHQSARPPPWLAVGTSKRSGAQSSGGLALWSCEVNWRHLWAWSEGIFVEERSVAAVFICPCGRRTVTILDWDVHVDGCSKHLSPGLYLQLPSSWQQPSCTRYHIYHSYRTLYRWVSYRHAIGIMTFIMSLPILNIKFYNSG